MTVWQEFQHYEQVELCEKARAGMTREQMTGASLYHAWLVKHYALVPKPKQQVAVAAGGTVALFDNAPSTKPGHAH